MRILHFTPSVAPGDGVSNGVLFAAACFRHLGFETLALADQIPEVLATQFAHYRDVPPRPGDLLCFHHSVGVMPEVEAWLQDFPGRRWMIYHNITPEFYFAPGSLHAWACRLGREQLRRWPGLFSAALADSEYNRRELRFAGYRNTHTLPLLLASDSLLAQAADPEQVDLATWQELRSSTECFNLLFVGRVAPNKCQHQLLALLARLKGQLRVPLRLHLVGGVSIPEYDAQLRRQIEQAGLQEEARLVGKVSDAVRNAYLRAADLYLSLSEHEGFGIPFLEAMAFRCPVAAYAGGAIAETVGAGGLLLRQKHPDALIPQIAQLIASPLRRRQIVAAQPARLQEFRRDALLEKLCAFMQGQGLEARHVPKTEKAAAPAAAVRIEGPLDSHYSLALVNREMARAGMRAGAAVHLHNTEGGGDYAPDLAFLRQEAPDLLPALRPPPAPGAAIGLRNLYPPRMAGLEAEIRILGPYGWEESVFPDAYVESLNVHAHGVAAMSRYVKKTLQDNGVVCPVCVTGLGVDHLPAAVPDRADAMPWQEAPYLLHVSSAFPRKGCDCLFSAFERAVPPDAALGLVVKTFDNPHNRISNLLSHYRWEKTEERAEESRGAVLYRRPGDARWIAVLTEEMSGERMQQLYRSARALVLPTRGEGFCLPAAEAMLAGCPVVITAAGGQADFCTPETVWPVACRHAAAQTHLAADGGASLWYEPDETALVLALQAVLQAEPESVAERCRTARQRIARDFTWDRAWQRLAAFADRLRHRPPPPAARLALVSTWNTRCGIAEHSRYLASRFPAGNWRVLASRDAAATAPDGDNVRRCWSSGETDSLEELWQELQAPGHEDELVLIQFNFSFFRLPWLRRLILRLTQAGRQVSVFFHSTADVRPPHRPHSLRELGEALPACERLYVHTVADLNRLRRFGLDANATLFPHGVMRAPRPAATPATAVAMRTPALQTLVANGFLLPHKGFYELIEAFDLLKPDWPELRLHLLAALHPAPVSAAEAERLRQRLARSRYAADIRLDTEYHSEATLHGILAESACVIYPYRHNQESSSAAVRFGLASGRPVVTTPCRQFADVENVVYRLPGETPAEMAAGLNALRARLQEHPLAAAQAAWVAAHDWHRLSRRLWQNQTALWVDRWYATPGGREAVKKS